MKVYYDKDCDLALIKNLHVGIVGFESNAMNLLELKSVQKLKP